MRRRVHQLLAALSYGDAIGNEALAIQGHLRAAGFDSEIFAERVHPRMASLARPLWEYPAASGKETVCLFHFSIGSAAGRLAYHAPGTLVSIYHNITPARFFLGFHPHLAGLCYHGRRELAAFADRTALALGDSEFNRKELEAAGYRRTGVLPIVLDLAAYRRRALARGAADVRRRAHESAVRGASDPQQEDRRSRAGLRLLSEVCGPRSRLLVVGDYRGHERYYDRLQEMVRSFGLDEVVFAGQVDEDDLMACYSLADLFLCLSEHEGFGVPLWRPWPSACR